MKSISALLLASSALTAVLAVDSASSGKIIFSDVGYAAPYHPISKIKDGKGDSCYCELSNEQKWYSGVNAPFSEPLAVHVGGPIKLTKFAHYTSEHFVVGKNTSAGWNRGAYFGYTDGNAVMDNVTFLSHVGKQSDCLGKALSYFGQDVVTPAKVNGAPGQYLNVSSGTDFLIYSNISCPKSGVNNACGVYRKDIPAFYGFDGVTKMFLFEFTMPNDTSSRLNSPSIWLSSDSLARVTAGYGFQSNCSCLFQGCGEYNVFTANATHMNTTIITQQGKNSTDYPSMFFDNIGDGYFERPVDSAVVGGVVFDSEGNVITFISNNATFASQLSASTVNSMLEALPQLGTTEQLKAGNLTAPSTSSSRNAANSVAPMASVWFYLLAVMTATVHSIIGY